MPTKTVPLIDTLALTRDMGQEAPEIPGIYTWWLSMVAHSGPWRPQPPSTYAPTGHRDATYAMTVIQ